MKGGRWLPLNKMMGLLLLLQRVHRVETNASGDGDMVCLREPYPGEHARLLARGSMGRAQSAATSACVERPRKNGGARCPECLQAIMNGNIDHQPLACTTCSEEHGFDCSCSCASLEATILAGALGDSYRWSVDFRVGRQLLAERGIAAAMPWFEAGFRKRRGASREECATTAGCEAHEAYTYLNSAVHHKVEHDMEQMEYIVQKYSAPASHSETVPREILQVAIELPKYRELLKESPERSLIGLFGSHKDEWHNGYSAEQFDTHGIDDRFNRLIWRPPLPGLPAVEPSGQGAAAALLSPRDWRLVELQWAANSRESPAIIVLDDVLRPAVMERVQEHMLESTYWFEAKQHKSAGYLGAYLGDGFASHLLLQVGEALQEAMPSIVGHLPLYGAYIIRLLYSHSLRSGLAITPDHVETLQICGRISTALASKESKYMRIPQM